MKKIIFTLGILASVAMSAQIYTTSGGTISGTGGNVGIGNTSPIRKLDVTGSGGFLNNLEVNGVGNNPSNLFLRGNGGYIPAGITFEDTSYNQSGKVAKWSIFKGNDTPGTGWFPGLGFVRYDAVNACAGGICDISLFLHDNGNVGIGTVTPQFKLDVAGNSSLIDGNRKIVGNSDATNYYLGTYPVSGSNGLDIHWYGGIKFGTSSGDIMKLNQTGQVEIGAINLQSSCTDCSSNNYKLFVEKGIRTEQVKVDIAANNGWADYVFKDDYQLRSLEEVESYIKDNGHLPEVPSEKEAIQNGIELKAMNILLLKKIEELTLYTIDQQKRIEALETQMKSSK